MEAKRVAVILATLFLMGSAFGAINLTATVNNQAPTVGEIQLCDGTCAYTKTVDPATEFTIKATVTDADADLNTSRFGVHFYKGAFNDTCTAGWDCRKKDNIVSASANGCTASGTTYCLTINAGDWSTKFLAGAGDINVIAYDNAGLTDSNESTGNFTVNSYAGVMADASSGTYSGNQNTTENAITTSEAKTYLVLTHNGNTNIEATLTCAQFTSGGNTIAVGNQKWNSTGTTYGGATACNGSSQNLKTAWGRGTDPTSATCNAYLWLDIPSEQAKGEYTSTLTIGATVS